METFGTSVSLLPTPLPGYPPPPAGIVVADALPVFRSGLLHVLREAFATHTLHEAATMAELLQVARCQLLELVILTSSLPQVLSEAGAIASLREAQPRVAILVLVDPATTTELTVLRLLRQHVDNLLLLNAPPAEICAAVGRALQRSQHYSDYALGILRSQLHHPTRPRAATTFSDRQLDVLRLLAADHTNQEIADYLCTSVRTVEYHRSQMLQKVGARTSLGLVLFAQRQGLLATIPGGGLARG